MAFLDESSRSKTLDEFFKRALRFSSTRDPDLLRDSLRQNLRERADGRITWKWDPSQFSAGGRAARDRQRVELVTLLPKIACPALVVRGSNSDLFSADDAHDFVRALPRGQGVTIAGAGHNVHGDEPLSLARAIDAFVRNIFGEGTTNGQL
jgi:pimeloyl-ACP methyl ester carboxylesterase